MKGLFSGILPIALTIFALVASPARADDYSGHKLAVQPANFIFGYGSLINSSSRNSTASVPTAAVPVRISASFGFIRTWNDRSLSGFTALGLRRPSPGEAARTINGVIYPVEGEDMSRFDAREEGYVRLEVPLNQIEAVGWQSPPSQGHVWVYAPRKAGAEPGIDLPPPDADFPLLQSYIDVVVEGGLEYGEDFAREILDTTDGWNPYWLNDRELARRPWVHDAKAARVDALLGQTPNSAPLLKVRAFPETYGARYLAAPSK